MPAWQKVDIPPGGNFIGWGKKEGQYVEGKILDYDETGGQDFNGKVCPQLEVELTKKASSFNKKLERTFHEPGETVTVTCGTYELKRGIIAADPARGDMIRIELDGEDEMPNGNTVKRFSIQIAHGSGGGDKKDRNVRVVESLPDSPAEADDEIPF